MEPTNKVSLTYEQLQALGAKMGADIGKARELTAEDYDYPVNNPDGIAWWLLPAGLYNLNGLKIYYSSSSSTPNSTQVFLVIGRSSTKAGAFIDSINNGDKPWSIAYNINEATGSADFRGRSIPSIVNALTSSDTSSALSAAQGKTLKDLIDALDARVAALEGN